MFVCFRDLLLCQLQLQAELRGRKCTQQGLRALDRALLGVRRGLSLHGLKL